MAEYSDCDVQELADFIVDALIGGAQSYRDTLARAILGAGWRRQPTEQLPADERPTAPRLPCPEGFHWIGQRWDTCDQCGLPATEHAGMAALPGEVGPFYHGRFVLDPWKPGQVGWVDDPRHRLRVVRRAKEAAMAADDQCALQALRDLEKTVMAERDASGRVAAAGRG